MNLLKKINNPCPPLLDDWKTNLATSLFIALFLPIFQPFGLQKMQIEYKELILAGYGLVTFLMLILNAWLKPFFFAGFFQKKVWTFKKQLLLSGWTVCMISIGNYLYSIAFSISSWEGLRGLLLYILYTGLISVIPITLINYLSENFYLKKNLAGSGDLNRLIAQQQQSPVCENQEITFLSGKQTRTIPSKNLIFIESMGNYMEICYLKESFSTSLILRTTLKQIESTLESPLLFKCHRAYIINLSFVEKVKGNSQGYSLVMKHTEKEIPVARGYTKIFKERMMLSGSG